MFLMRFDMRNPGNDTNTAKELYQAAIDMAIWAEQQHCLSLLISEHHTSRDGYLPSPMILATAIAARTQTLPINIGALLLNMYDPIKLAEDMVVLDIISQGRVVYTVGLGYRQEEYAMFGVDMKDRANIIEEKLAALLKAITGQSFEYQGRMVQVTPSAYSPNGFSIGYGGHSKAAARRAGRFGLNFFANGGDASLEQDYREAAIAAGQEPGVASIPNPESPQVVFIANDLEQAWNNIGPSLLHDAQMYREWEGEDSTAVTTYATSITQLREEQGPYRIVTPEQAIDLIQSGQPLMMHPLCGGCPPKYGWESLRLLASEVLPSLAG